MLTVTPASGQGTSVSMTKTSTGSVFLPATFATTNHLPAAMVATASIPNAMTMNSARRMSGFGLLAAADRCLQRNKKRKAKQEAALPCVEYPQGDLNPCYRTENPGSWATRRWGRIAFISAGNMDLSTSPRFASGIKNTRNGIDS